MADGSVARTLPTERPAKDFGHVVACGCEAWRAGFDSGIEFCAMHAAAADLLDVLERTAGTLTGVLAAVERDAGRGPAVVYEVLAAAHAAIAKARPCPFTSPDECAMAAERSVAGISDTIPGCATHGRA